MRLLHLEDYLPPTPGACYHVARASILRQPAFSYHTHDFPEVFWIERGRGAHLINGQRVPLTPGTLVLIRPSDAHDFRGAGPAGFTLVNVAFALHHLESLRDRYYANRQAWPWRGDTLPATFQAGPDLLARLRWWSGQLSMTRQNPLELDCFLLDILQAISASLNPGTGAGAGVPLWLRQALAEFADPQHLALGPGELVRLSGCCHEHVNRVVRRHLGKTTTDLVNQLRMEHAGRQLRMTSRPIVQIAAECGISNLGYFYDLFRRHHGVTPRRYRLAQHVMVRSPV